MTTKLLVVPIVDGKAHGEAIQAKKFSFRLEITNCGDIPSSEFTIWRIVMEPSEPQSIMYLNYQQSAKMSGVIHGFDFAVF